MQSGRKADKIFRICVVVIAVLIVVYACAAAINGWTYINTFVLDADERFGCFVQGDKPFIEHGLRLLIEIYLENCHSGNEIRMKVADSGFRLRAVYVEFSDDVVDLLNGNLCSDRETALQVQSFNNYIVQLNGSVKTHSAENGCYTEIMLKA